MSPNGDITASGVIAIGGACATSSGGVTVNGLAFTRITYGVVIFNKKSPMRSLADSPLRRAGGHARGRTWRRSSDTAATVRVTLLYESLAPEVQTFAVPANSRFNVPVGAPGYFPTAVG